MQLVWHGFKHTLFTGVLYAYILITAVTVLWKVIHWLTTDALLCHAGILFQPFYTGPHTPIKAENIEKCSSCMIQSLTGNRAVTSKCGNRWGRTWPRGHTPCWQVYNNKTRVMTFILTKFVAYMSTSWLLGNVYTAKSCKGKKRAPDALKLGLVS
jgi:hypothetical protein